MRSGSARGIEKNEIMTYKDIENQAHLYVKETKLLLFPMYAWGCVG